MSTLGEILTLEELLDRIEEENPEGDRVDVRGLIEAMGDRSFGPLLLVPGLIAFSPLSGIPGVSTLVGVMLFLISAQLLVGRKHFWLPELILRRSISRKRFEQTIRLLRRVAHVIDGLLKPRLGLFVDGPATWVIAVGCCLIALVAPFMELLPFAISGMGAVVATLGFGLLARDGLLILLAVMLCSAIVTAGVLIAS